MLDYQIEIINDQPRLERLIHRLGAATHVALDLETINWWNSGQERIALIQFAFRCEGKPRVAIIDALAKLYLEPLRVPLESAVITKIIHNAAFDATRLAAHLKFTVAPVFDTMLAARRSGEKQYSLRAQAEQHLNLRLDKTAQRDDWSVRPLDARRIAYAALDAVAALLLFEHQSGRGLDGSFRLRTKLAKQQSLLPLDKEAGELFGIDHLNANRQSTVQSQAPAGKRSEESLNAEEADVELPTLALLGVIAELPSRYYPEQLAASVGAVERAGLTGWILDQMLGRETDVDEAAVKLAIVELCDQELVRVTATRRLTATKAGTDLWRRRKPN